MGADLQLICIEAARETSLFHPRKTYFGNNPICSWWSYRISIWNLVLGSRARGPTPTLWGATARGADRGKTLRSLCCEAWLLWNWTHGLIYIFTITTSSSSDPSSPITIIIIMIIVIVIVMAVIITIIIIIIMIIQSSCNHHGRHVLLKMSKFQKQLAERPIREKSGLTAPGSSWEASWGNELKHVSWWVDEIPSLTWSKWIKMFAGDNVLGPFEVTSLSLAWSLISPVDAMQVFGAVLWTVYNVRLTFITSLDFFFQVTIKSLISESSEPLFQKESVFLSDLLYLLSIWPLPSVPSVPSVPVTPATTRIDRKRSVATGSWLISSSNVREPGLLVVMWLFLDTFFDGPNEFEPCSTTGWIVVWRCNDSLSTFDSTPIEGSTSLAVPTRSSPGSEMQKCLDVHCSVEEVAVCTSK